MDEYKTKCNHRGCRNRINALRFQQPVHINHSLRQDTGIIFSFFLSGNIYAPDSDIYYFYGQMRHAMRNSGHWEKIIMALVFAAVLVYTLFQHLQDELWNDEVYSISRFILVPLKTTLTDYHVPNNHVLFSFLIRFYLLVIGFDTPDIVLGHPLIARLPLVLVALGLIYFFWKTTEFYFNDRRWRMIALILLCSNMVFGNYILQYRGYGLSALFLLIVFYCLAGMIHGRRQKWHTYPALVIASFGAFYTVPSNIYFLISMAIYPFFIILKKKPGSLHLHRGQMIWAGLAMTMGIAMGLLAYSPMLKEVFFNDYTKGSGPFEFTNLERMLKTFLSLASFHFILLFYGVSYIIYQFIRKELDPQPNFIFLIVVCMFPFFLSFLHGDIPPPRVYSVLVAFFTLLLTQSLVLLTRRIRFFDKPLAFGILSVFLLLHFVASEVYTCHRLGNDNSTGKRNQGLLFQYYNYHFNSLDMVSLLRSPQYQETPVYIDKQNEEVSFILEAFAIHASHIPVDELSEEHFILISTKPKDLATDSLYMVTLINSKEEFFKIYLYERI